MTYIPKPGTSINQLQDAPGSLQGTDFVVVNRGGTDYRATLSSVNTFIGGTAPVYATAFTMGLSAASGTAGTPVIVTYTPTTNAWPVGTVITPTVATLTGTFSPTTITVSGSTPGTTTFTPTSSAGTSGSFGGTTSPTMTNTTGTVAYAITATTATAYTSVLSTTSGFTGSAVTVTLAPTSGAWPATTLTPSLAGSSTATGTFSPTSVTPTTGSSGSVTVSFTPSTAGSAVIHTAHTGGTLTSDPADKTYTVSAAPATGFTFAQTGTTGNVSTGHTVTVTPVGGVWPSGTTITPAVSGVSGTYSPTPIAPTSGVVTPATSVLTPTTAGTATLSVTNNQSWTAPSNLTYTVTAVSDPSTIMTAPLVWFDASKIGTLWQDTAATVPVTADGQSVSAWTNSLTNGAKKVAGGVVPIYHTAVQNGLPGLQGSGSGCGLSAGAQSWLSTTNGDVTAMVVCKGPTQFTSNGSGPDFQVSYADGFYPGCAYRGTFTYDSSIGSVPIIVIVARVKISDTSIHVKVNSGTEATGTYTGSAAAFTDLFVGNTNTGSWIMEAALSTAYEADSVRDALISYARTKWGF